MNSATYRAEVLRTYAGSDDPREKLTLCALGLTGESGARRRPPEKGPLSGPRH